MSTAARLGYTEPFLKSHNALWTAREIAQQPQMLRETQAVLMARRGEIEKFLHPLLQRSDIRIVLTGAGTSAFIGESLAPWLATASSRRVEAIATTDLISAPELYLADVPTLLVSFGRSGNSPESLAAIQCAEQRVRELHNLVITCNHRGAIAQYAAASANCLPIMLPDATHDRSFAMTSSYSCQCYAALAALSDPASFADRIETIATSVAKVIDECQEPVATMVEQGFERVAYLGSHLFKGVAREAALKLMELTDGAIPTLYDSPVGFRHGPKTFVTNRTLVMLFVSNNPLTRSYDLDLLDELRRDGEAVLAVVAAGEAPDADYRIAIPGLADAPDCDLVFPFIAAPQVFAFRQSLRFGLAPDCPNTAGTVNRVVQGVRIHSRA